MLLFNPVADAHYEKNYNFNTSNVTIQLSSCNVFATAASISIHLMLLFNIRPVKLETKAHIFQYI